MPRLDASTAFDDGEVRGRATPVPLPASPLAVLTRARSPAPHLRRANDLPLSPVAATERSAVINAKGHNWLKEHGPRWGHM